MYVVSRSGPMVGLKRERVKVLHIDLHINLQMSGDVIDQYQTQRFLVLRNFINTQEASNLLKSTLDIPIQQVRCHDPNIRFGQQKIPAYHPLWQLLHAQDLVTYVFALQGKSRLKLCQCWSLVYRPGEYIDPHTDKGGSIQILVCLQAPLNDTYGGSLLLQSLEPDKEETSIFLAQGDAIVFEATTLVHHTTPIARTEPEQKRVVAVGRYYL